MFFYGLLHMDMPELANQQEIIYISVVWIQDEVWKTSQKWQTIGMDGERERELGKFVMSAWLNDDDDR